MGRKMPIVHGSHAARRIAPLQDLNLLRPLCALLEERHVSRAAERCAITQPAMSRILERLRADFDDELLVRSGRRYERSPRAERLLVEVRAILESIEQATHDGRFEPERCDATFRVATTDYASAVLVPDVLRALEARAPHATLELTASGDRTLDDVAAGRVDVAITSIDEAQASLSRERLFDDTYVCVVADAHPLRARRLTLERYLAFRHVAIAVIDGAQPAVERALSARGVRRAIGYRTPFLTSAALIVAKTSLVLTIPRRLAERIATGFGIRTIAAPPELERFGYAITWHARLDASPAHAWFRELVGEAAATAFGS